MNLTEPVTTAWGRGFHPDDDLIDDIIRFADELGWEEGARTVAHDQGGVAVAIPLYENSLSPDTINWLSKEQLVVAWRDTDADEVPQMHESDLKDEQGRHAYVADTLLILPENGAYNRPEPPEA